MTGHTGFKGAWLSEWLLLLGAKVYGYSLEPPTEPSLFSLSGLSDRIAKDIRNDIRDYDSLKTAIEETAPDFIFHLAAQPIVRRSFAHPRETFETNAVGTFNVLEAVREMNRNCIAILITTDKVYENREWVYSYRENDALGGYDPYSASKACAEIVISSYFRSFFKANLLSDRQPAVAVASARAGNVIGGGDWAEDRIVPDCIRSLSKNETVPVRNKVSTRPWQHVLEPLSGYLLLASRIHEAMNDKPRLDILCSSFNFGPDADSNRTVLELVNEIFRHRPGTCEDKSDPDASHEAGKLNLACDKAFHLLNWKPRWSFERTVKETVDWYVKALDNGGDRNFIRELTVKQIKEYSTYRKNDRK